MFTFEQNRKVLAPLILLVLFAPISRAPAQDIQLQIQQPPYYVGESVVIQVSVKGFTGKVEPSCRLVGSLAGGIEVTGPTVNQSVSRFMQFNFGGQTTTQETVNYSFQFLATASSAGEYAVGPFEVEFGGRKQRVEGTTLTFSQLADDPDMSVSATVPSDTFYVGQRVPVKLSWACAGEVYEIEYAFRNLQIRSPLFDQFELETVEPRTSTTLSIATASGTVSVDAKQAQQRKNGRTFIVLTSELILMPRSVGKFDSIPVTCRTKRGLGWRQEFFGGVSPSRSRPAIATGQPLSFTVKPLPEEGRPPSFAGAVGSGYAIDVTANRTVVRVGDPISLDVSLRGEGLEKTSLPDLSVEDGLDPARFHLPSEPPPGNFDGKTKQFKVNVRVKNESVNQIPGLAFSWFDPERKQYFTARSKPIALQVMPAQVRDADDVITAAKSGEESTSQQPENTSAKTWSARGANLAIERDVQKLVSRSGGVLGSSAVTVGSYVLGVSSVLLAVFIRRRMDVDPAVADRRQKLKSWRQQIAEASQLPGKQAAEQIASNLRKLVTIADDSQRAALNELIGRCEVAIYAPRENAVVSDLATQALQLVDGIKTQVGNAAGG